MDQVEAASIAQMIEAFALDHYTRDIKGEYALRSWRQLADQIRENSTEQRLTNQYLATKEQG